jgi:hypothetical protein
MVDAVAFFVAVTVNAPFRFNFAKNDPTSLKMPNPQTLETSDGDLVSPPLSCSPGRRIKAD